MISFSERSIQNTAIELIALSEKHKTPDAEFISEAKRLLNKLPFIGMENYTESSEYAESNNIRNEIVRPVFDLCLLHTILDFLDSQKKVETWEVRLVISKLAYTNEFKREFPEPPLLSAHGRDLENSKKIIIRTLAAFSKKVVVEIEALIY